MVNPELGALPIVPYESVVLSPNLHCLRAVPTSMEGAVGISADDLVSLLSCQEQQTLVLDCRPFMSYNAGHVIEAINVHCPPILKRRSGGFVALENIVPDPVQRERLLSGGYQRVLAYDQSTRDLASTANTDDSNLYSVVKSLIQQVTLESVFYLVGGYDAFSEDCPLLCVSQQFSLLSSGRPEVQPPASDSHPVEILPYLFLGNVVHSSDRELLQRLRVTALVNVSTSCANHFMTHFRYLHIPVNDSACEDLSEWFHTANHFIEEVRSQGGRVLVHCHFGRSRSATVCIAYLMRTLNLTLDGAFEYVRSRRHLVDPNLNFMRQLQDYRQRLDKEHSLAPPSMSAAVPACLTLSQPPRSPREAPAPFSLSPAKESNLLFPARLDMDLPPPSPAQPTDIQCFFSVSVTSSDLTFPEPLPMTPEIFQPMTPEIFQPS